MDLLFHLLQILLYLLYSFLIYRNILELVISVSTIPAFKLDPALLLITYTLLFFFISSISILVLSIGFFFFLNSSLIFSSFISSSNKSVARFVTVVFPICTSYCNYYFWFFKLTKYIFINFKRYYSSYMTSTSFYKFYNIMYCFTYYY